MAKHTETHKDRNKADEDRNENFHPAYAKPKAERDGPKSGPEPGEGIDDHIVTSQNRTLGDKDSLSDVKTSAASGSEGGLAAVAAAENAAKPADGHLEGPNADERRRIEQKRDHEAREAADGPLKAERERRKAAIDRLEAEISRHDRYYDEAVSGLMTTKPIATAQALHDVRLEAIRAINTPNTPVDALDEHTARLAAFEFVSMRADNAAGSRS